MDYEFSYQSKKQKAVLTGLKIFVGLLMASAFHALGWMDQSGSGKFLSAGTVLVCVWAYGNLARVKVEIQELFIPPFDNLHTVELMLVGAALQLYGFYLLLA